MPDVARRDATVEVGSLTLFTNGALLAVLSLMFTALLGVLSLAVPRPIVAALASEPRRLTESGCAHGVVSSYATVSTATFSSELDAADWFGRSAAALGDLDGDGGLDFAIGAPGDDDGGGEAGERGAVYVLHLSNNATVQAHNKIGKFEMAGLSESLLHEDYFGSSLAPRIPANRTAPTPCASVSDAACS